MNKRDPFENLVLDEEEQEIEKNFDKLVPLLAKAFEERRDLLEAAARNSLKAGSLGGAR